MHNAIEQTRNAIADHLHMSSNQMTAHLHIVSGITHHIGTFHRVRAGIYLKTFERMAATTDMQALLELQQDFVQDSMDNLLSQSKAMAEMLARPAFYADPA